MSQNQPFQGETSSNQVSNNINELIHTLGNEIQDNYPYWTDEMARLMITAISYIADAESFELGNDASSKKVTLMPTMTKWKVISMVMNERGYNVLPQQCEDKFRDIDNKYRQMTGLLGSAMSCKVVENPILLDSINMPEIQKEEVKKLLSSEQFLYLEMYSFHHGNCFFLSPDLELCRSVFLYLAAISDNAGQNQIEMGQIQNEMGRNQIVMGQGQYQMGQNHIGMGQGQYETGRNQIEMGQGQYETGRNQIEMGEGQYETGRNQIEMGEGQYEMGRNQIETGQGLYETGRNQNASKVANARWVELEEKSLEIQRQKLEIEKARFEWLCFKCNKELNLEKMRLENESQKLQNARLVFELKRRETMSVDENN